MWFGAIRRAQLSINPLGSSVTDKHSSSPLTWGARTINTLLLYAHKCNSNLRRKSNADTTACVLHAGLGVTECISIDLACRLFGLVQDWTFEINRELRGQSSAVVMHESAWRGHRTRVLEDSSLKSHARLGRWVRRDRLLTFNKCWWSERESDTAEAYEGSQLWTPYGLMNFRNSLRLWIRTLLFLGYLITSLKEGRFSSLSVYWFVSLSGGLWKNYRANFNET